MGSREGGDDDSPFGQELFDIMEAQTEAMIQPYGMTDELRRKAVTVVLAYSLAHQRSLPDNGSS